MPTIRPTSYASPSAPERVALCRVYDPVSIKVGGEGVMADQKEVVVYIRRHSWRCWLTRRLFGRLGYRFKVIDATNNSRLCARLAHFTGRETMPYVFIDHRPVGGLSEIRALEHSGALEHLVRGGV
jgi:glutaredoxin